MRDTAEVSQLLLAGIVASKQTVMHALLRQRFTTRIFRHHVITVF